MTRLRLILVVWAAFSQIAQVRAADNPVEAIHDLTLQWTGLEHQKDVLESNWRNDKPVLEQQLALLERETRELNLLLEASAQEQGAVEQKRLELLEEQTRFEQEQAAMERGLGQATLELRTLHPQLPPPLLAAWEEKLPSLDDPLLTASEKLQVVLELLSQLDDFQQKITLHETVMTLADGQDYLVQQVYLGLSHGWYITADQRFAAAGTATPDGWVWQEVDDAAAINQVIAILERRSNPVLVEIPLRLSAPVTQGGN
jgi:hypothetical protein